PGGGAVGVGRGAGGLRRQVGRPLAVLEARIGGGDRGHRVPVVPVRGARGGHGELLLEQVEVAGQVVEGVVVGDAARAARRVVAGPGGGAVGVGRGAGGLRRQVGRPLAVLEARIGGGDRGHRVPVVPVRGA